MIKSLEQKLIDIKQNNDFSVRELAEMIGTTKHNVEHWLSGKRKCRKYSNRIKLRYFLEKFNDVKKDISFIDPLNRAGCVYIVQIAPTLVPNRLKVGFTSDITRRLLEFNTLCPEAKVVYQAPAISRYETKILRTINKEYIKKLKVGTELYDVDNVDNFVSFVSKKLSNIMLQSKF